MKIVRYRASGRAVLIRIEAAFAKAGWVIVVAVDVGKSVQTGCPFTMPVETFVVGQETLS